MLYRLKAQLKGLARRALFHLADKDDIIRNDYGESARQSCGYNASLSSKVDGCLGFIRRNEDGSDGSIQFAW